VRALYGCVGCVCGLTPRAQQRGTCLPALLIPEPTGHAALPEGLVSPAAQTQLRSTAARHAYAVITGLVLVWYPFGKGVGQVIPPLLLTYSAMALVPRACGAIAWLNMAYLIWL